MEQSLIEKVKNSMNELNEICKLYTKTMQDYELLLETKKQIEIEKKVLEQKQKKEDKFFEIVLLESSESTRIDEASEKLLGTTNQLGTMSDNLNSLRTGILRKFRTLPFPIDPHNSVVNQFATKFKTIKDTAFEENTLRILSELLQLPYPLHFEGVTYHSDEVIINSRSIDVAMNQIVTSVRDLREKTRIFLKAYSNIDTLCERIMNSNRYAPILEALSISKKSLSVGEISKLSGLNRNLTYQACYNMLRDSWSPNPIKKIDSKFSLSTTGKITMKRCNEKQLYSISDKKGEMDEDLDQTKIATEESETKEMIDR